MTTEQYLNAVLSKQTLAPGSPELTALQDHRDEIQSTLRTAFKDTPPVIRYGGSKAKNTMIRESYDLDLTCYFARKDGEAGDSLKEIYDNVRSALATKYATEPKTSAVRVRDKTDATDFHIDIVPGRFVDGKDGDVFLYQASGEKQRLKTNLDTHIEHIRDSGVTDAIRLSKLWNARNRLRVKTFVLELLVVKLLDEKKKSKLPDQLQYLWEQLKDHADGLAVEDPANPSGNDLSPLLDSCRATLSSAAAVALKDVERDDWEAIFGPVDDEDKGGRVESLRRVTATVETTHRPWSREW